jgi:hypothetical protein
MTPKLAKKSAKPDAEKFYVAIQPLVSEMRTVKQGDRLPGSDPFVTANPESFYAPSSP